MFNVCNFIHFIKYLTCLSLHKHCIGTLGTQLAKIWNMMKYLNCTTHSDMKWTSSCSIGINVFSQYGVEWLPPFELRFFWERLDGGVICFGIILKLSMSCLLCPLALSVQPHPLFSHDCLTQCRCLGEERSHLVDWSNDNSALLCLKIAVGI